MIGRYACFVVIAASIVHVINTLIDSVVRRKKI